MLQSLAAGADAPASGVVDAPRRRKRSTAVPLVLSGVFHCVLILAMAAIVWRTAVAPGLGSAVAGVTFENPGDAPAPAGGPATSVAIASGPHSAQPASEGSLAPLLSSDPVESQLTGLATTPKPSTATPSLGGLVGASLASGSLFSGATVNPAGGAIAGVSEGAPSVSFGGLAASSVSSVVYAVDCSGPMVTSLPMVIQELERSIGRLNPSQRVGVVLFHRPAEDSSGPGAESFAPVLVRATPSAKQLLHDWLAAVEPSGRSSPLAGLELAISHKPDAIFLLSRSIQRSGGGVWDLGLEPTMDRLEQLNPVGKGLVAARRPVLIQTIQFLEEDPTGIMQAIGQRHGGGSGYRVVKRQQDLQAEAARAAVRSGESASVPDR